MPRTRRFAPGGHAYHVGNRGNDRRRIFRGDTDYQAFLSLLREGKRRYPVKVFGLCLMPNHMHVLVEPECDGALSAYAGWVSGGYACHWRSETRTVGHGHVFQERFWNRGIEDRWHFLSVLRYIEANPVSGGLVSRAEEWPWSSLSLRSRRGGRLLDPLPIDLPERWSQYVNGIETLFEWEDSPEW